MKNLTIISLLFLYSCAKDGKNIYVEGRVVNPVTGEGIPNITLDLRKQVPDPGGSGSDSKTVKTVLSDQNGYFTIAHNGSLFNSYIIHMSNSNGIGYHVAGWKDASGPSLVRASRSDRPFIFVLAKLKKTFVISIVVWYEQDAHASNGNPFGQF